jgi:hypothetical protein
MNEHTFTTSQGKLQYFLSPPFKAGDEVRIVKPGHSMDGQIRTVKSMPPSGSTMAGTCQLENGEHSVGWFCNNMEYASLPYPEIVDDGIYEGVL